MEAFQQIATQWMAFFASQVTLPRQSKLNLTQFEARLLEFLRTNTAPIKGITTKLAAQKMNLTTFDLRLPMRRLCRYNLIYSKKQERGVAKLWIAY